jgi:hypothetical protein
MARVTRFGEFSPNESLFTLGSFMKITEIAQFLGLLFSTVKVVQKFGQKMCWATFWAIFSRTHLATLLMAVTDG